MNNKVVDLKLFKFKKDQKKLEKEFLKACRKLGIQIDKERLQNCD